MSEVLSLRWLDRLPEWAKPVVWGVLFSLPPVALIIWFAQGGQAANVFLCSSLTMAGAGIGIMLHAYLRKRLRDRAAAAAATRSRFRALLANELKTRPLAHVDFSELVAASDIARPAADDVAAELFGKLADRCAADGIVTEKEQRNLKVFSKALNMDPGRAERIESEAKTARYQAAVSDALADGTVTDEEAHLLNKLRWQLGVEDSAWTAGDLVSKV